MTIKQKLDLFAERTQKSVELMRQEESQKIQNIIKNARLEAEATARSKMRERLKSEKYQLDRESNKKVYEAKMVARRNLLNLRERLIDELINDLEQDLRDFVATDDYQSFLQEKINTAKECFGSNFDIEMADESNIGGFKLVSKDNRLVLDFTLLTGLKELNNDRGSIYRGNIWDKRSGIDGDKR